MTATTSAIAPGARVTLHVTLSLAQSGREVETTRGDAPLELTLGDGQLVAGLERRLLGLVAGDRRRFEVPCDEAYGLPDPDTVHTVPRAQFPEDIVPEPGLLIGFATPAGDEVLGVVQSVGELDVVVDFSHPLAGHDLIFDVEIVAVQPGA